uniref:Glycosyltransferases n=1 Tax=Kalanchoe fedtschenkoi TaxID=63787 RepID=A0A7N1A363_KALFE
MASTETRPNKKRVHLWKKALVQFVICFVMGFFFGFAPTSIKTADFSSQPISRSAVMPQNTNPHGRSINIISDSRDQVSEPSLVEKQAGSSSSRFEEAEKMVSRRLIIIVSPMKKKRISEMALLRKLSNTLALVPQPLLWIVTEGLSDSPEVSETLRKTGIMYRHLVYKENFTDPRAEKEHHRNVALNHIEQHKLSGIVHFAELANVYDLGFFDEIREIEGFGAWPVAWVSGNMKKGSVMMEGPVCDDLSQVIGWHLNRKTNQTDHQTDISISSFAFNSSILWDPERWGRSSLIQDDSQNSMNYVKQAVYEDEGKLKGLPSGDCSRIMLWHLLNPHYFKLSK